MPSAYIEAYMTPGGTKPQANGKPKKPQKRWRVRARVPISKVDDDGTVVSVPKLVHLGSRSKRSDAEILLEWAQERLRHGRIPRAEDFWETTSISGLTVTAAVTRYLDQRPDLSDGTKRTYKSLRPHIDNALGKRDVATLEPNDIRELVRITAALVGPDATRSVKGMLAGALDHAGVRPNPARDPSVKLPRRVVTDFSVPPFEHVQAILRALPHDLLLPVALLEATGARVSELVGITYADVDHAAGQIRLVGKGGKIRLVPLPPELGAKLPRVAAGRRLSAGRIWPGLTADRVRKAMAKACEGKDYHWAPHSLRRRFASRHMQIGTPVNQTSMLLGHAKTSLTLDVYSKILMDGDTAEAWRAVIH